MGNEPDSEEAVKGEDFRTPGPRTSNKPLAELRADVDRMRLFLKREQEGPNRPPRVMMMGDLNRAVKALLNRQKRWKGGPCRNPAGARNKPK